MFEPERKQQTYLLKSRGKEYFLCRQAPDGGFHKMGSSYDGTTILYRLETAARLGDTIVPEEGDAGLASLVENFARLLDEMRFRKAQDAIQKGLYEQPTAPAENR